MKCKRLIIFSGLLLSVFFSFSLSSTTFATSLDIQGISVDYGGNFVDLTFDSEEDLFNYSPYGNNPIVLCSSSPSISDLPNCSDFDFIVLSSGLSPYLFFPDNSDFNFMFNSNLINSVNVAFDSNLSGDIIIGGFNGFDSVSYPFTYRITFTSNSSPSIPTGNLDIIENGQYNVTDYATATVNVPQEISETPYDDKFDQIIQAIYVCAGTMLVIYFFYCIYRMIIKGVKL